ncbi:MULTISPECIES: patatin-like phospholipase family protein [Streptomyces]|uniref:Patatin-like phospholipase family protein n=1 Tax=Streptomyces katrae TaxID=68223 RepID=A0ABT7GWT0_9ACTN|nr:MULTISPECIES: patatin-like phospholipase family protein [Streptomyces]MDK9497893.1 patatin-like phospholipase family protein [Streptomyces katrae]RST05205.1 patatin-like phospholipase family protein [Streptomyces sp. WAC07149]GLX16401.1 patatin [Streptomyces lavendulae subsp. lavendulae]GLX25021.1 patatin [Streptomyces lavendulae subsp. lavendulae]
MGDATALVLGGGGLTGVGWESGILYGLARAGVDLTTADLVVGTSAGSVVGAQLTAGLTARELYERQLGDASGERPARLGAGVFARHALAMVRSRDAAAYRRRVGAFALAAETGAEAARREVLAARLVSHEWPERRLVVTAVDALSGAAADFDRESGAGLVDAVAASCAVPGVWPPVTVGGRRFIDGGVRSATNADLAAGYARVVILAPIALGTALVPSPASQAARLRAAGARVLLITPSPAARKAFGRNVLDPARRDPAARAGLAQAAGHAADAAAVWAA